MKKKSLLSTLLFLVLLVVASGCNKEEGDVTLTPDQLVTNSKSMALIKADNRFNFALLQNAVTGSNKNLMLSPLSISTALSMTLNGAAGITLDEMIKTMGKTGLTLQEINTNYLTISKSLQNADPGVAFTIANSIWIRKDFPVSDPFITTNQEYYRATIEKLAFDLTAVKTINDWVNRTTSGKIPTIIDQISSNEILFLINAIYFNGKWQTAFNPANTSSAPFYLTGNQTTTVQMMKMKTKMGYTEKSGYSAIRLPYGSGNFAMTVLLPSTGETPARIAAQLDESSWNKLQEELSGSIEVDLQLPRFKYSWEINLNETLKSLGMPSAFDPLKANFTALHPTANLYITRVIHKTFIDVNEAGTEAAAVTSIGVGVTSVPSGQKYFVANRPFLFFITEKSTGAILFSGKVENPQIN